MCEALPCKLAPQENQKQKKRERNYRKQIHAQHTDAQEDGASAVRASEGDSILCASNGRVEDGEKGAYICVSIHNIHMYTYTTEECVCMCACVCAWCVFACSTKMRGTASRRIARYTQNTHANTHTYILVYMYTHMCTHTTRYTHAGTQVTDQITLSYTHTRTLAHRP